MTWRLGLVIAFVSVSATIGGLLGAEPGALMGFGFGGGGFVTLLKT